MAVFSTNIIKHGILASAMMIAAAQTAGATEDKTLTGEKVGVLQNAAYSGITCDHVRAKVAESGVAATYAYARYMGLTSRDIAKVRKACSV